MIKVKNYFSTVLQGKSIKDKAFLFVILVLNKVLKFDGSFSVTLKNSDGDFICKSISDIKMYSIFREVKLRRFFKISNKGVFIDVGANIGKYSIMMANKYKKGIVIAIEPDIRAINKMKDNLKLNKLNNVYIIKKVVGSKNGNVSFYLNQNNPARNSIFRKELSGQSKYNMEKNQEISASKVKLKSTTIDSIFERNKHFGLYGPVSLIKLDIQGAEYDALVGSIKIISKYKPTILFEAWNSSRLSKISKLLEGYKYKIIKIDKYNYCAEYKDENQ